MRDSIPKKVNDKILCLSKEGFEIKLQNPTKWARYVYTKWLWTITVVCIYQYVNIILFYDQPIHTICHLYNIEEPEAT